MKSVARALGLASLFFAFSVGPSPAASQSRAELVRWLETAPDARTRAQAALTIGRVRPPGAREALEAGLGDGTPAVRAACAVGLAALGDAAAVPALEARASDADADARAEITRALAALRAPPVDWARVRYVVGPGHVDNSVPEGSRYDALVRDAITDNLRGRPELAVHTGPLPPAAAARARQGRLRAFSLDGGVRALQRTDTEAGVAVRAEVSLVLVARPANAILGLVSGAATARGGIARGGADPAPQLEAVAIRTAVRGALQNLETSLATVPR